MALPARRIASASRFLARARAPSAGSRIPPPSRALRLLRCHGELHFRHTRADNQDMSTGRQARRVWFGTVSLGLVALALAAGPGDAASAPPLGGGPPLPPPPR